jgi:orotidine-5'-phosphate decarboxylase
MTQPFGDRLAQAVSDKKSVAVIGIDPRLESLPPELAELPAQEALTIFGCGIIDAVCDLVPAVKPNIAFFEAYGLPGLEAYNSICAHAKREKLLVIGDVKRGDIGSTAAAYAEGLLSPGGIGPHDCLTLNPYLGSDSLNPFLETGLPQGQGFFILVKTSNPSSAELQNLELKTGGTLAEAAARLVESLGKNNIGQSGLSSLGAVVGATHREELARYRELMPHAPFLIPGYGAQGGTAADVCDAFRADGSGALVNASRSVIFAWKKNPGDWQEAARNETLRMNADLLSALRAAGKWKSPVSS